MTPETRPHPHLPRYTWDQAHILGLATAGGFAVLDINAATIRSWAARGRLTAAGKAPGGALLYPIEAVVTLATTRPGRRSRPPDERCATI